MDANTTRPQSRPRFWWWLVAIVVASLALSFITPGDRAPFSSTGDAAFVLGGAIGMILTDIPQIASESMEIVLPFHRQGNGTPSTAIRWPDFEDWPSFGRSFAQIFRHSDRPLLSFSPGHRFSGQCQGKLT